MHGLQDIDSLQTLDTKGFCPHSEKIHTTTLASIRKTKKVY